MIPPRSWGVLSAASVIAMTTAACTRDQSRHAERVASAAEIRLVHLTGPQIDAVLAGPAEARVFVEGDAEGRGMRSTQARRAGPTVLVRFPFELRSHVAYRFEHPALEDALQLSAEVRVASPPMVLGLVPRVSSLPSNVLRLYVTFSEPMSAKFLMSDAVEIVDMESGEVVQASLLDVERPLFDPTHTRLTVVFNPGRTKRGVGSHGQGGPPLKPHRSYGLRVKAGLRDAEGDALQEDVMHVFETTAPNRDALDVTAWSIATPTAGTREDLRIGFDHLLDPYQAEDRIALLNPRGRRFPVDTRSDGSELRLRPLEPWQPGCYRLIVSGELEDVSGNRTARAFDDTGRARAAVVSRSVAVGALKRCGPAADEPTDPTPSIARHR